MATEAQRRAVIAYNKKQDSITLRPDKETGAAIRKAAQDAGKPLQRFILDAVLEKMGHKIDN